MEGGTGETRPDAATAASDAEQVRALEGDRGLTVESEIAAGDAEAAAEER